jgi:probable HAF family extracellular repeat protein
MSKAPFRGSTKAAALAAAAATLAAASIDAMGQCLRYTVDIIQPPACGSSWFPSIGTAGLNEDGDIVGARSGCGDTDGGAYSWYDGSPMINLQALMPPGMVATVFDINSSRQIVGDMLHFSGGGDYSAILIHNNIVTPLGMLSGHTYARAFAISEQGVIAGYSQSTSGWMKATVWQNNQPIALDLPLGPNAVARSISDTGLVCGWMGEFISSQATSHAFIHDLKSHTTIDVGTPLPGTPNADATGVNSHGNICGHSRVSCGQSCVAVRGFYWSKGHVVELGSIPGFSRCDTRGINDSNTIVGGCSTQIGDSRGFVWKNGTMHALQDLVHPPMNLWISNATGINNAGQIAAYGILNNGPYVALRLNPVPPRKADVNCDWVVNHLDLLEVIRHWGPAPPPPAPPLEYFFAPDINGDGVVNVNDLLLVINNWG